MLRYMYITSLVNIIQEDKNSGPKGSNNASLTCRQKKCSSPYKSHWTWILSTLHQPIELLNKHVRHKMKSYTGGINRWGNGICLSQQRKLTVPQLVKKFPEFFRTQRFIIVFTTANSQYLSCGKLIQSTASNPASLRSILILSSRLPSFQVASLFRASHQCLVCTYSSSPKYHMPRQSQCPWFRYRTNGQT